MVGVVDVDDTLEKRVSEAREVEETEDDRDDEARRVLAESGGRGFGGRRCRRFVQVCHVSPSHSASTSAIGVELVVAIGDEGIDATCTGGGGGVMDEAAALAGGDTALVDSAFLPRRGRKNVADGKGGAGESREVEGVENILRSKTPASSSPAVNTPASYTPQDIC